MELRAVLHRVPRTVCKYNARMHVGECHIMHVGDFLRLPCCTYCTCSPARENKRASYLNLLASPARETSMHALPRIDMSHDIHVAMRYDTNSYCGPTGANANTRSNTQGTYI